MEEDDVICPRCGEFLKDEEFYGVCATCSADLRARFDGVPRSDVSAAEYEPKINVTPNAVASKE
jgi:hypothetical protein